MADPLLDLIGAQPPSGATSAPATPQAIPAAQSADPLLSLVGAAPMQSGPDALAEHGIRFEDASANPPPSDPNTMRLRISGTDATPSAVAAPLSRTDKFLHGAFDPIDAGAQLLTHVLPKGVVDAGNAANNWLADKTGIVARIPEGGQDQMTQQRDQQYQAQRAAQGETGFDGYRMLGNVASPANLALASRVPVAATLGSRMALGAGSGAGFAALTPVVGGDFADEKIKQMGIGVATGGLLPAVTGGLARIISPKASTNPSLQLLTDEGVQPTIGQALGGAANSMEQKMTSVPVIGDMITRARQNANTTFQTAAFNRALAPIGQELPPGLTGRAAVLHTETTLNNAYDDVLNKIGSITVDQPFAAKVASLQGMVKGLVMPADEKAKFASALSDVSQSMDQNGAITSDAYKALESSLGSDARKLGGSQNIYENKVAPAVKQLQAELRALLERQAGSASTDLKAVNTGWANFIRVQNAAGKLGAEDGMFSPAQFLNSVRATDKSKNSAAFARGTALGQDLGDAGKSVLGSSVPDSGTPGRMWMNAMALGSGAALNPAIPAAMLAGGAAYTSPVQRALVGAVSARPQAAESVAEFLRRTSPYLGAGLANGSLGLLNQ